MRIRSGIILVKNGTIALIERQKPNRHYFVFPGGGVEETEYTEEAAIREAKEELGLDIEIKRLVAIIEHVEKGEHLQLQMYYYAEILNGEFGTGSGEEFSRTVTHGTYKALWMPLNDLSTYEVYPSPLANHLANFGIPNQVVHFRETKDYSSVTS